MRTVEMLRRLGSRAAVDPRSVNVRERVLAAVRGAVNPMIRQASASRPYDLGRTLVVAGFPRSGTTWLAEILSSIPGTGIVFEPLDIRRIRAARAAGFDWENFISPDEERPLAEGYLRKVLAGQAATRWTLSHLPISSAWRVDRWVVKFVRANQMLAWMVAHFRLPPPILLVRHPCAVYDSWTRRGWPIHGHAPAVGMRFFEAYPAMRSVLTGLRTPEEYFAADWAMQHYTPLHQLNEEAYQLCYYERLRLDGTKELRRIFDRWSMPLPSSLDKSLNRPSAKASGQASQLRGSNEGPRWRARLDPIVVERILDVVDRFGLSLYASGTDAPA